jgi:hypothetical protein
MYSSAIFSQAGYSPFIDSVKSLCTFQTLSQINRQLSGDTSCIIGGNPYTIQTRYWNNFSNAMAAQFIYERFQSFGLSPNYMYFSGTGVNVYAVKVGTKYPNKKFIICSHYDDMPSGSLAPGADDNASGTCAVLESARLLAPYQFDYTIIFIAFDEEERGLYGSHAYADSSYYRGDSIMAVFNYDMIAWDGNNDNKLDLVTNTNSVSFTDNVKLVYNMYLPELFTNRVINNSSSGSDHWYFWQRGYKALCGIETNTDFNPYYHTINDNYSHVKMNLFLPFTRAAIASLMTFGWDFFMDFYHNPIISNNNTGPQTAVVVIHAPNPIAKNINGPRLYFKVNNGVFSYVNSHYNNLDTFLFQIPGQPAGANVSYYIAAQDSLGRYASTLPPGGKGVSPPGIIAPPVLFNYSILTGVANNQNPVKFSVDQNYPNPFNGTTNIRLYLPRAENIEIIVTDVLGRVINEALNGKLPAGENVIQLNADNLSSGIYFYSVFAGQHFVDTKRMILVK